MADTVGRSMERLEDMVADLLVLAREERKLIREALSLDVVIGQVLDDMAELAYASGVKLRLSGASDVMVYGNAALLSRVFGNLVENGIRYNRPGGEVAVAVQQFGEWAVVTVTDTGVGISPQEQARIFERFYRVDETRAQHKGGTGLGLAIVAHIVQSHAGQIDVRSTPGAGSTFTVKLPAVRKS
jgi:two-component system sensor histidine kinase SenX3